ncbi:hypothetical protein D3C72_1953140 [compost metagenome]
MNASQSNQCNALFPTKRNLFQQGYRAFVARLGNALQYRAEECISIALIQSVEAIYLMYRSGISILWKQVPLSGFRAKIFRYMQPLNAIRFCQLMMLM